MNKKLYKSSTDKKISGVCAGFGEFFGIDATIIRVIYAVATFFTASFPGVILYIILAFILPENPVSNMDNNFDNNNDNNFQQ